MHNVALHEKLKSAKNNQNKQQPITPSRHCAAQTTPTHLYWCGANPPGPWPALAACHGGDTQKRGYVSAIFARFSRLSGAGVSSSIFLDFPLFRETGTMRKCYPPLIFIDLHLPRLTHLHDPRRLSHVRCVSVSERVLAEPF